METLNHPEFVALIERDQELYDKISVLDPEYSKKMGRSPRNLHKNLIELSKVPEPKS